LKPVPTYLAVGAVESVVWVEQHEAVKIYARFFKKRHGRAAGKRVREKAEELKRKGDLRGHEIWTAVAREMEQPPH
jgi:hypothetical protein